MLHAVAVQAGGFATEYPRKLGAVPKSDERRALAADHVDTVELGSVLARNVAWPNIGGIREELVGRIRAEIAAGTYLTDQKLDIALSRIRTVLVNAA